MPMNASTHHRTRDIRVDSRTSYPEDGWTTSDLLDIGLLYEKPFKNACVTCQLKSSSTNLLEYQQYLQTFPKQRYPELNMLTFSDTNLTGFSDFRCFGEISEFHAVNTGLHTFPVITFARTRLRRDEYYDQWDEVNHRAYDHYKARGTLLSPEALPLQVGNRPPLSQTFYYRLSKERVPRALYLSLNSIRNIVYTDGMDMLDLMVLSHNRLHGSGLSNLSYFTNISYIDLSHNPLEYLPDNLFDDWEHFEGLFMGNCQLKSLDSVLKQNLTNLVKLNVPGNRFTHVPSDIFTLPKLLFLDLSQNEIGNLTIPADILSPQLIGLYLMNSDQKSIPSQLLTPSFPKLEELRFWMNDMTSESMLPVVEMNISHVRVGQRGVIQLLFNCIEYIPLAGQREVETLNRVLNTFTLYLHHNPLHCSCEEMIAWLQSRGVRNTYAIRCDQDSLWISRTTQNELVSTYPVSRCDKLIGGPYPYRCKSHIDGKLNTKLITSLLAAFVLLVILVVVVKKQGMCIKQRIFTLTGLRLCPHRSEKEQFVYDAFVSYSNQDYRWIFQTLRPGLEEDCDPPYSLCVHDRDFVPGIDIALNVFDAVQKSRSTILVLSPHSSQSEWCGFELNAAVEERTLRKSPFSIIPVVLDHVSLHHFTTKQRRVLNQIPFLAADDVDFFAKLKYFLGKQINSLNKVVHCPGEFRIVNAINSIALQETV